MDLRKTQCLRQMEYQVQFHFLLGILAKDFTEELHICIFKFQFYFNVAVDLLLIVACAIFIHYRSAVRRQVPLWHQ